jgi:ParB-like chromosome segregation protein Spo0J
MTNYEFHPFADVWRLFSDEELAKLKADIQAHGLRLPIILYQGKILDGRNRYRACQETGTPLRYETAKAKNDAEALALVVSLNEHRRHLSEAERAFIAEQVAAIKHGMNRDESSKDLSSLNDAANLMNVSHTSVKRARSIKQHAPELEADVKAGRKSLSAAADEARAKGAAKRQPKVKAADGLTAWKRAMQQREQRALQSKPLTREEYDPDFKGTGMEFVEKHGKVQPNQTAVEVAARNARVEEIKFLGGVAKLAEGAEIILLLNHVSRSRLLRRLNDTKQHDRYRARMKALRDALALLDELALEQDNN